MHEMKMLRASSKPDKEYARHVPTRGQDAKRRKKKKKTKSLSRRFMEEVFDAAEDIFDIFD
ncbi:MAG: hypothetical protein AAF672_16360 [Pseudomonadota bacterium]